MDYSKIKKVRIKDFRCIGDIVIDFTKSPIVSLIGDNESGKTSVVKSFATLGCNADARNQKEYIRDNTKGFGIIWELEDGTLIKRIKTDSRNTITIERDGKVVYNTDKIDAGLPPELQNIVGLLEEPETKELLQVRTYEDSLLFINTKSSENYKVMYNALKVDNLSKALSNGIKESNIIKSTIQELEGGLATLKETAKNIRVLDLSTLIKVRDKVKLNIDVTDKLGKLTEFKNSIDKLEQGLELKNELACMSEIKLEFLSLLEKLNLRIDNLNSIKDKLGSLDLIDKANQIDLTGLNKLDSLVIKLNSLHNKEEELSKYSGIDSLELIDTWDLAIFESLLGKLSKYSKNKDDLDRKALVNSSDYISTNDLIDLESLIDLSNKVKALEEKSIAYKETADKFYNLIKESGVCVADCPNCGSSVVVDMAI